MTNFESTGAAAVGQNETVCKTEEPYSNKQVDRLSKDKNLAKEMESKTKEYIENLIEGRKKNNAFNNQSVQATLDSATEWSKKHHGKVVDLSDIV